MPSTFILLLPMLPLFWPWQKLSYREVPTKNQDVESQGTVHCQHSSLNQDCIEADIFKCQGNTGATKPGLGVNSHFFVANSYYTGWAITSNSTVCVLKSQPTIENSLNLKCNGATMWLKLKWKSTAKCCNFITEEYQWTAESRAAPLCRRLETGRLCWSLGFSKRTLTTQTT